MPADLPGFYFDSEKNRYFPNKGPIPGGVSKRVAPPDLTTESDKGNFIQTTSGTGTVELIRERELCGNGAIFRKKKFNIQDQFCKRRVSRPTVWKYGEVDKICGSALEHMRLSKITSDGLAETDVIITGCSGGTLSLLEVEQVRRCTNYEIVCNPKNIVPHKIEGYPGTCRAPLLYRRSRMPEVCMPSPVSSLKTLGKDAGITEGDSTLQKALYPQLLNYYILVEMSEFDDSIRSDKSVSHSVIVCVLKDFDFNNRLATTGSDSSRGSVYILDFSEPVEFDATDLLMCQRMHIVASFDCTVWTADCSPNGYNAVIGTNMGARVLNLESGQSSWICRSKSDILSQQIDRSGNIILCGLRNGAIVSFDIRQKGGSGVRLNSHKIFYPPSTLHKHSSHTLRKRNWFELKGDADISRTIFMPSSISSMALLCSYDQYFLASSMDGSLSLYDQRMNRKVVQSYSGHINSHTRIQLGVDPSDTYLMSGGEDCNMRIWDIKSGQLLCTSNFMSSVPSTLCWSASGFFTEHQLGSSFGAWVGSNDGLYLMLWP